MRVFLAEISKIIIKMRTKKEQKIKKNLGNEEGGDPIYAIILGNVCQEILSSVLYLYGKRQ